MTNKLIKVIKSQTFSRGVIALLGFIVIWELKPKILFVRSVLKPFITDMTIINVATPSMIPRKEKIEITFKKPSFFLGLRFLVVINFSTVLNNLFFYKFNNFV